MTDWQEITSAGSFARFAEPGDTYIGTVRNFDPDDGATTYDGDPCGFVDIEDEDGEVWRISLDKPQLRDPIRDAARRRGMDWIDNTLLSVEYVTDRKSERTGRMYKHFSVKIAVGNAPKKPKTIRQAATRKPEQANLTAVTAVADDLEAPF